jgi:hypothetical protein
MPKAAVGVLPGLAIDVCPELLVSPASIAPSPPPPPHADINDEVIPSNNKHKKREFTTTSSLKRAGLTKSLHFGESFNPGIKF